MTYEPQRHCPEPETLAAFAERSLNGKDAAAVVEHLDECEECMSDVALAIRTTTEEGAAQARRRTPWVLAAAAAAVLAIVAVPAIRTMRQEPIERLVAMAPRFPRAVEPRLTGGFAWGAYEGPARAADNDAEARRLKLAGVAGDLVERAANDGTPDAHHAAGVALVLLEKPERALAHLEAAARAGKDARRWSDLAAARYAAAAELARPALYTDALAAADAALRADATLPEALFNRALILEKLGLTAEARRAWERYLATDGTSPWAVEARARLAALPTPSQSMEFERDRKSLERAAMNGDAATVRAIAAAHRERLRAFAEAEYLAHWAEALQRGDAADAQRWLTIARAAGDALTTSCCDALAREAVRAVDAAAPRQRATLADAHLRYRAGRLAYSRHDAEAGARELHRAAAFFAAAKSPMALAARYYAASARLARHDVAGAREELERVRADADARPRLVALRARVRGELARALLLDGDWSGAVPLLVEAASLFRIAGEPAGEANAEASLATAFASLGRADDAWSAWVRAFTALSAEAQPDRLAAGVGSAARAELRAGRRDAALALLTVQESLLRAGTSPLPAIETRIARSMIETLDGRTDDALRTAASAREIAGRLADVSVRARQLADIEVAAAAARADTDPHSAAASLTRAIDFYRVHELPFALPEPLLLRARCALRGGDAAAAARDLDDGIAALERHGLSATPAGSGVLDPEHELFAEAIGLALARGDAAAAFAYTERARGGAIDVAALQRRLAGTGTAVVEIVALPRDLVTFAIAADAFAVARRPRAAATLAALAERTRSEEGVEAATALYDDVLRPIATVTGRARSLVIVPDRRLENASFAALYDRETKSRLVERIPLSLAASATSLREEPRRALASVAVVALPDSHARALPDLQDELADVARAYPRATVVTAAAATKAALFHAASTADVLHIAGHTERQGGAGEQALVLAGAERVSSKALTDALPVRAAVVVLAACETLRAPASSHTRALSLGAAFAAAGAGDVVGTMFPIGDRDARRLFAAFHRHLARGATAAAALREAQLGMMHDGSRGWRSVAVLTTHVSNDEKESRPWVQ